MKKSPSIELETPIVPEAIARAVWHEASAWLGKPLPRQWVRELIAEARTVYANNARFRRRLRAQANRGRDHLWMFMRHWLAARLHERRPQLYAQMPSSYSQGEALPPRWARGTRVSEAQRERSGEAIDGLAREDTRPTKRCVYPDLAFLAAANMSL